MSIETLHGTAIAFGSIGVLLRGPSGSGKSSLALRLIDGQGYGLGRKLLRAELIADDQVEISRVGDQLFMAAPYVIKNRIEIRGLGILPIRAKAGARLRLLVDLKPASEIERMPLEKHSFTDISGVSVRRIELDGHNAAAPTRLRAALHLLVAKQDEEA
jgi:HPr kinase/phosphorylase